MQNTGDTHVHRVVFNEFDGQIKRMEEVNKEFRDLARINIKSTAEQAQNYLNYFGYMINVDGLNVAGRFVKPDVYADTKLAVTGMASGLPGSYYLNNPGDPIGGSDGVSEEPSSTSYWWYETKVFELEIAKMFGNHFGISGKGPELDSAGMLTSGCSQAIQGCLEMFDNIARNVGAIPISIYAMPSTGSMIDIGSYTHYATNDRRFYLKWHYQYLESFKKNKEDEWINSLVNAVMKIQQGNFEDIKNYDGGPCTLPSNTKIMPILLFTMGDTANAINMPAQRAVHEVTNTIFSGHRDKYVTLPGGGFQYEPNFLVFLDTAINGMILKEIRVNNEPYIKNNEPLLRGVGQDVGIADAVAFSLHKLWGCPNVCGFFSTCLERISSAYKNSGRQYNNTEDRGPEVSRDGYRALSAWFTLRSAYNKTAKKFEVNSIYRRQLDVANKFSDSLQYILDKYKNKIGGKYQVWNENLKINFPAHFLPYSKIMEFHASYGIMGGNRPVVDDQGNPVMDSSGNPVLQWWFGGYVYPGRSGTVYSKILADYENAINDIPNS